MGIFSSDETTEAELSAEVPDSYHTHNIYESTCGDGGTSFLEIIWDHSAYFWKYENQQKGADWVRVCCN